MEIQKTERLPKGVAKVTQLGEFDAVIDVRSPGEFADDHVPGALNCPVLSDEERARVGTIYKQVSPFEARKVGAALIARNIGIHLDAHFQDKARDWRPLVYCWRGGQRSGIFTHFLREIGWGAYRIEGGYKSYRRHVIEQLAALPGQFRFRVVSGATGNAKSRVLEAMSDMGAQVLHLEALADHKGSVLGALPGVPQPSQCTFETRLHQALSGFSPQQTVFVEAESRRIGALQVPDALLFAMRASPCLRIEAPLDARVDFLLRDYDYFSENPAWLADRLPHLKGLQSNETLERWAAMATAGEMPALFRELMEKHYDPLYQKSQDRNYRYADAPVFPAETLTPEGIRELAVRILEL